MYAIKILGSIGKTLEISDISMVIFDFLSKEGSSTATKIAKYVKKSRTNIYYFLDELLKEQLILKIGERKNTKYVAAHPSRLKYLLNQKKLVLQDKEKLLEDNFQLFLQQYSLGKEELGVYRFEGLDGLKTVYNELLKDKVTVNSIVNRESLRSFIGEYNDFYIKERIKKRIKSRVIAPSCETQFEQDTKSFREVRTIPKKLFPFDMDFKITSKKIVLTTFEKDSASGIIIIDKEMSNQLLKLFEFFWNISAVI
jgi:sugar-specific transcriptional regulator TrmB